METDDLSSDEQRLFPVARISYIHRIMALYYFTKQRDQYVFFTDTGSLRNILLFAGNEFVSVKYLLGRHSMTNKIEYMRDGRVSGNVNTCMRDYLPGTVQMKLLFDSGIIVSDFVIHFQNGIKAYTDRKDIIVKLIKHEQLTELFEAFQVPPRACPALLTQPGTMISVVQRTGSWIDYGYFKTIEDFIQLPVYERPALKFGKKPCPN